MSQRTPYIQQTENVTQKFNLSYSVNHQNLLDSPLWSDQEIRIKCESSFALPKPAIPGEFASIIINYNKELAKDKETATQPQGREVLEMQSLFG